MVKLIRPLLVGASVCLGINAIGNPAFAGNLTNTTVDGAAPYITYDANSTNTFLVPNSGTAQGWANERKVLGGNSSSPTGNIELFSNSETLSNAAFQQYTGVTNLKGQIGGQNITLSSLTLADWLAPVTTTKSGNTYTSANGGTKTLGQGWFEGILTANGFGSMVGTSSGSLLFNTFQQYSGFQRFSDPNVSYVNQDDQTGLIRIGLAGHMNATPLLLQSFSAFLSDTTATSLADRQAKALITNLLPSLSNKAIQASELIKYSYNGKTGYLYSYNGTQSGLVEQKDGVSHSGNYEVTIAGIPPKAVPEPSMMIGIFSIGGLLIAGRKRCKSV
ncbi:MAG TPA: NF038130 family PEP-CTERM protein [Phormidium sp.]